MTGYLNQTTQFIIKDLVVKSNSKAKTNMHNDHSRNSFYQQRILKIYRAQKKLFFKVVIRRHDVHEKLPGTVIALF